MGSYSTIRTDDCKQRPVDDAGSADYAERHASHVTELPSGLVRVDVGEPVKRLACEALAVPVRTLLAPPPVPAEPQPVAPAAPAVARTVSLKEHRAITREP